MYCYFSIVFCIVSRNFVVSRAAVSEQVFFHKLVFFPNIIIISEQELVKTQPFFPMSSLTLGHLNFWDRFKIINIKFDETGSSFSRTLIRVLMIIVFASSKLPSPEVTDNKLRTSVSNSLRLVERHNIFIILHARLVVHSA